MFQPQYIFTESLSGRDIFGAIDIFQDIFGTYGVRFTSKIKLFKMSLDDHSANQILTNWLGLKLKLIIIYGLLYTGKP